MNRALLLTVLALSCSDEPTCDNDPRLGECVVPGDLPPRLSTNPWPTFEQRRRELNCACNGPRVGTCSDGKQFAADGGGFAGATLYFRDGQVVGQRAWGDVIQCVDGIACLAFVFGDFECDETSSEVIACDASCDSAQPN